MNRNQFFSDSFSDHSASESFHPGMESMTHWDLSLDGDQLHPASEFFASLDRGNKSRGHTGQRNVIKSEPLEDAPLSDATFQFVSDL